MNIQYIGLHTVESPGVGTVRLPQDLELPGRHPPLPRLAQRECKQLRNIRADEDSGQANTEELVDKGQEHGEQHPDGPRAHGRARRGRVVLVVDDGADLGVGAVVGDERSLKLHLCDERLVLLRVGEDVVVLEEGLDPLQDDVREVGVALVDSKHVGHQLGYCVSIQMKPRTSAGVRFTLRTSSVLI